jgi:hypothetical protein
MRLFFALVAILSLSCDYSINSESVATADKAARDIAVKFARLGWYYSEAYHYNQDQIERIADSIYQADCRPK